MLGRFLDIFRGRPAHVQGTSKLPEGYAKNIEIGDPLAGGKVVVLCRVDGELHALDARCPHEGGRIMEGPLANGREAVCPLHNYHFDPKTGKVMRGVCSNATTYRVREQDGECRIWT